MVRKIDFFIIGAQKSGTTALHHYLSQHPEVFLPRTKENHYFVRDEFYCQGDAYLTSFYADARNEPVWGGADVDAMHFAQACRRIYDYNPRMKLLAVLRNPIDRAYSAFWFARRTGTETCTTFEEGLDLETERLRSGSEREKIELAYATRGQYARQLKPYVELFGRSQVRILLSEDLFRRPNETMLAILEWLQVRPSLAGIDVLERINPAGLPHFPTIHRFLVNPDLPLKRLFRRATSPRLRHYLRTYIKHPMVKANTRSFTYPQMDPQTRERLKDYFAPFNAELSQLIEGDLTAWS